jgi:hypothetical protein
MRGAGAVGAGVGAEAAVGTIGASSEEDGKQGRTDAAAVGRTYCTALSDGMTRRSSERLLGRRKSTWWRARRDSGATSWLYLHVCDRSLIVDRRVRAL